jgi:hypothetical protein
MERRLAAKLMIDGIVYVSVRGKSLHEVLLDRIKKIVVLGRDKGLQYLLILLFA